MSEKACAALGIDAGSATVKILVVDRSGKNTFHLLEPTEPELEDQIVRLLSTAKDRLGSLEEIPMVATGYGRNLIQMAHRKITEITCHAQGAFRVFGHGGSPW